MTIIKGDIASPPNEYEAYLYKYTNEDTGKIYLGYHVGSVGDDYHHSSTNEEFNQAFSSPNSNIKFDVLSYGSKVNMLQLENKYLSQVDAKNNDQYYNKTNGSQQFTHIDLTKCESLVKDINDGRYPTTLEDIKTHFDMAAYQARFQHDDAHQKEIKEAVDQAMGDTQNCFGKGKGLRVVVFEGRGPGGTDMRVDGNHSVYGAHSSKHCRNIAVIRIPFFINKDIVDSELSTFSNLLNPRDLERRKETDISTAVKYLLDNYNDQGIPIDSETNLEVLKAIGFTGSFYKGAISRIKSKASDIIEKDEGKDSGREWINYQAKPHNKTIAKAIETYNQKEGWCSIKCSSAYFRYDRALEAIYDANKVAKITNEPEIKKCKMWIFHPSPSEEKKWEDNMAPKWRAIAKQTVSENLYVEITSMPCWQDDIQG